MQATWLILTYLLIVVIGQAIVVTFGLVFLDRTFAPISVPVSIFMYLAVFFIGWKLAVRLTEPSHR